MKIQRAIMATDANPEYYQFWPVVAKRWSSWGITPTLAVVSDKKIDIDERLGDVVYHIPNPDVPTPQQAQIIRLFLAASYEDDVCLISDIDMLPLRKDYFTKTVEHYNNANFVVYSSDAYPPADPAYPAYPMCYLASDGENFKEIIGGDLENFNDVVSAWLQEGHGWHTDEKVFFQKLQKWDAINNLMLLLRRGFNLSPDPASIARIDRSTGSIYDENLISSKFYVDYHMPRPYEKFKEVIDNIYEKTEEQ
jgi:hypothetical protein